MKSLFKKVSAVVLVLILLITTTGTGTLNAKADDIDYSKQANEIPLNGTWHDYLITENQTTDQWFKFTVPADGAVDIKVMAYMKYLSVEVYNEDLSLKCIDFNDYFYGSSTSPVTKESFCSLSAGTYYIKVVNDDSNAGKYRISLGFTNYGANDGAALSYDSPQTLSIDTPITGAFTMTDSTDWYRLNIPVSGTYVFKIVSYNRGTNFYLYNNDMTNTITKDYYIYGSITEPATKTYEKVLSAGTYYIKCNYDSYHDIAGSNSLGKYVISYSKRTQANCSHDYKTTYVYATYFDRGYTQHTCNKCGYSYRDEYTSKLTLSKPSFYTVRKGVKKKTLYVSFTSSSNATGYQVRYSTNKSFKKCVKTQKTKKTYLTIKKLKKHKKYYVQTRAYKKSGKKIVYSKWSAKRSARTK